MISIPWSRMTVAKFKILKGDVTVNGDKKVVEIREWWEMR